MKLTNRTILITGAAGGLGSALALECAAAGASLVLLDKNRKALGDLSDQLTQQGFAAPGLYPMDLGGAGYDDFTQLVETISSSYGGLDGLVHCALDFDGLQPLDQVAPQDWLRSVHVNLNAPWLLSCSVLPLLKQSGHGRLFFLLDDLDEVTGAYWGAYGTGKAALAGMVKQFDDTLSGTKVAVRGINPGAMRTAFRAKVYHAENPLEQPDPAIVAGRIVELLGKNILAGGPLVDLSV